MKKPFGGLSHFIGAHKIASFGIALVLLGGGYYSYNKLGSASAKTTYTLAPVQKGTIVAAVSGSGQVSVSNQVDIKPKVSGQIIALPVAAGQTVAAGTVIARIDAKDAEKAVRDAEVNLQSAKLSLKKLQEPADSLSLIQAQNALATANQSKQNATDALAKAYDDGFNTVANTFLDIPGVVSGLDSILNGSTVNGSQNNVDAYYDLIKTQRVDAATFRDAAVTSLKNAETAYNTNLDNYRAVSRYSDKATIEALLSETYDTTKLISEATKNIKNYLDLVSTVIAGIQGAKPPAVLASQESSLLTYTGTTNTDLGNLLNIKNSLQSDKDNITNANQSITADTASLAKLQNGADPLDIQTAQLTVSQRQNALQDAENNLADYSVRAPFAGILAKLPAVKGDAASPGTAIGTLITTQRIAAISLNEVDAAKIKIGEKATLTFDAIPGLTITGEVADIDTLGTVTQGVVTYTAKIGFDTQDERVKPGMSVAAAIITDVKQDTLVLPNSAVKSQTGTYYVEELSGAAGTASSSTQITSAATPDKIPVTIGLQNDSQTEIVSGLNEGDLVITRKTSATAAAPAASSNTNASIRIPGISGGGGGARGLGR